LGRISFMAGQSQEVFGRWSQSFMC
jgi:hypothetical protein